MNKFTPGPWSTISHSGCGKLVVRPKGQTHVQITPSEDAYLMAAAPDLLEALERFIENYVDMVNSGDCGNWNPETEVKVINARSAIAKARGNV